MRRRRLALTIAVAAAASLLAACDHDGVKVPNEISVIRTKADSGEFALAASPPSTGCPDQTGVVAATWGDTYIGGHSLSPEFDNKGPNVGVITTFPESEFQYKHPGGGVTFLRDFHRILGDPQIVRLTDGRLLLLHMAFRGWPFERSLSEDKRLLSSRTAVADSYPSWDEYQAAQAAAKGPVGDLEADFARWALAHRQRSEQLFYVSSDCGKTWALHSTIDASTAIGGKCKEPRKLPTATGDETFFATLADGTKKHRYWPGGWDRPELYVDPWSGDAFTTMSCKAGENEEVGGVFMLRLPKGGTEWQEMPFASSDLAGAGQTSWVPATMTSTKSGALWVATCSGGQAYVHRRPIGGIAGKWDTTTVGEPGTCGGETKPSRFAGEGKLLLHTVAISRSGNNSVRVLFPTMNGDRGTYRKANVIYKGPDNFSVVLGDVLKSSDADASMLNARFIEYDQTVATEDKPRYDAVAYWMESSPGSQRARVRFSVMKAGLDFSKPLELHQWDVERPDADWGVDANGDNDKWNDHDGQYWAGDYWGGTSYCDKGKATFLIGWPAQTPDNDGHGYDLTVARMPLDRPCKSNVIPAPGGQGTVTMPTTPPPPPPSSSTTLAGSTTSSSSSSTSSSSTSSSSTSSSTSTTVAPQANRVTGISVSMGVCTSVNRAWNCPGTATFSLSGGTAPGPVGWDVFGTLEHSCLDTTPFTQPQPAFTAAAGQRSVQRQFTLVFPSNQQPNGKAQSVRTSTARGRSGSIQSAAAEFISQNGCTKP